MARADKTVARMRANPRHWRIGDVESVARAHGFTIHKPGGSHVTIRHPSGHKLTVPARRPIKPVYIRMLVELIDRLEGNDG